MGSLGNPKTWVPYLNPKDCTQGFCSWNCPQWCKSVFPPPPPSFVFPDDNSGTNLSPLVISIIGILASAFLLVSYYAIVRKYCGKRESSSRRENHEPDEESDENHDHDPSFHMPWHVAPSGLDEVLIKSIAVCKYKKGDGLVEGTECSVCLSEFQDDESLRLLPKCSHAFHLSCIDTWLTSHSNCPLCRANILSINASAPVQLSNAVAERAQDHESNSSEGEENVIDIEHQEKDDGQEENQNQAGTIITRKSGLRALSDVGNLERRDTIIEIPEEGDHQQHIRRSVSMDYSRQSQFSVADILQMNQEEDIETENVGSSKVSIGETSKSCHGNRVLVYVTNPVTMKRSFSSGKFFFRRHGRGRDQIISI